MESIGVTVMDSNGEMKSFGNVMSDIQNVWSELDDNQRSKAIAVLMDN